MFWLSCSAVGLMLLAAGFWTSISVILRRLDRRGSQGIHPLEYLESFDIADYRPLERVLREQDLHFLETAAGSTRAITKRVRRERRAIVFAYLRSTRADFSRLTDAAMILAVQPGEDRSNFIKEVEAQRWMFYRSLAAIYVHLWLQPLGFSQPNASAMLRRLAAFRNKLTELHPVPGY